MTSAHSTARPTIHLDVVLYREGEYWVGRCVQFNIATSGRDRNQVLEDAQCICRAQIIYALQHDPDFTDLFRPADAELLKLMSMAQDEGELRVDVRISSSETQPVIVTRRLARAA